MSTFAARLAALPSGPLYRFLDGAQDLDVDTLRAAARGVATGLRAERRAPVLVVTTPGADQPLGLFAAWEAGACAVPLYPPQDEAGWGLLAAVARDSGARAILAPPALAAALGDRLGLRAVPLDPGARGAPGPGGEPGDPALLLYTSGSTGSPKGAIHTHAGLLSNMTSLATQCGRSSRDTFCTWLPHAHVAGLYMRLLPVVVGGRGAYLSPATFLARPLAWLDALSAVRATATAAPDFAYALVAQLIRPEQAAALDLSVIEMLVSGGEVVRPASVDSFCRALAPAGLRPTAFHPYYGLTETLCTAIPQGRAPLRRRISRAGLAHGRFQDATAEVDAQEMLSNGPPLRGSEVVVVDPERGVELPPGRVGELWTRGAGVIEGYTGDPARSLESCAAVLGDGRGPWFRTGDLGVVDGGEVWVTGRRKELLIVRGRNHYPPDIEATVRAATGAGEVAAFAVDQRGEEALGLALEATGDVVELARRARRAVSERHGLAIAQMFVLPPQGLPRTPTRKLARHTCARAAADGSWGIYAVEQAGRKAAPAPDDALVGLRGEALRGALRARIRALTGAPDDHGPLADLGLSSIDVARAVSTLRRACGVELDYAPFFDGRSARVLADTLAGAMEGSAAPVEAVPGWRELVGELSERLPLARPPLRRPGGAVLLTGATGFLGSWLLAELLRRGHDVVCVVRAADAASGADRVRRALAAGPGPVDGRVEVLPGDVRLPRLGLAETDWYALGERVGVIVHNAADVNFVAPYTALRSTNVDPLLPLVELALAGGVARPLHLVSTLAVYNTRNRREQRRIKGTDRVLEPDHLYSGYAQSKWVAEALAKVAGHFAVPVALHRPGLVVGDQRTGRAHVDDFLCRFLKGCVQLGVYPDAAIELDLVAVDDVAAGIAAAVGQPVGTVDPWHWTTARPTPLRELIDAYRALGHPLRPEPLGAWIDRIRDVLPADNALFPVHPFLLERPGGAPLTLLELLDGLPLQVDPARAAPCPPVDPARMARWLQASGFLPTPPQGSR